MTSFPRWCQYGFLHGELLIKVTHVFLMTLQTTNNTTAVKLTLIVPRVLISGRCRRRERDLLALPRQILRLVIGVLTGQDSHTQVSRHLRIMGLKQDPLCSYCSVAEESASHFLCQCDYFATLRMSIWGKPDLYPADIDTATVGDIARFIKKIS